MPTTTAKRVVTSDTIVTVETTVTEESRFVEYSDLLDAVKIEADNWGDAPWDNCSGFEHTASRLGYYDYAEQANGANNIARTGRDTYVLEFDCSVEKEFDDLYRWYRLYGASKGVAAELVAHDRKARMELLVGWYENGWEYWYVCAEYNGYEADGCGGIDDYEYADTEYRTELANDLAAQLEADGFIVTGKPDPTDAYREGRRSNFTRKIHMFDWR
jgi:hypothetical protein